MCRSEVFIAKAPDVKLDRHGASLFYVSGGEEHRRRYTMDVWRQFLETETARLMEFDRTRARRVLPFKGKRGH